MNLQANLIATLADFAEKNGFVGSNDLPMISFRFNPKNPNDGILFEIPLKGDVRAEGVVMPITQEEPKAEKPVEKEKTNVESK